LEVVGLSGSLRTGSTNTELLKAAALVAPYGMYVRVVDYPERLPAFNPDNDSDELLPKVASEWRDLVASAHALIISCPVYAGGLPGALKNSLDWLVGDGRFEGKHVALLNTSSRFAPAQELLETVLTTMSARILRAACCTIDLLGSKLDASAIARDVQRAPKLRQAMRELGLEITKAE